MMTFEDAVRLAREIMDYYGRRLDVMAIGTFGRETGEWGISVYIDGIKTHRRVLWGRDELAEFSGDLVRLCGACREKRELHLERCGCGSTEFEVCQKSYSPTKRSKQREESAPAGMLF